MRPSGVNQSVNVPLTRLLNKTKSVNVSVIRLLKIKFSQLTLEHRMEEAI